MKKCVLMGVFAVAVALFSSVGLTAEEEPAGMFLKANGRKLQCIAISDDTNSVARFAAEELQKYCAQSFGVKLPIVTASPTVPKPAFVIGKNVITDALGLDTSGLPREGFYLKTTDDYVIIAGDDHPLFTYKEMKEGYWHPKYDRDAATRVGTLFGVYTFLKKIVGVNWYFPGPLGEVVPAQKMLKIPPMDFTVGPSFTQRKIWVGNDHTGTTELPMPEISDSRFLTEHVWGLRSRLGFSWACQGSHGMWFWGGLFGKDHPEYFSLVDGERTNDWGWIGTNRTGAGRDFCWANPATIHQQIEEMRLFFGGEIKRHMWVWTYSDINHFPIGANDGTMRYCECPDCSKWYYQDKNGKRMVQDAYYYHVAEVAKAAQKEFPGKYIVVLAYGSANRFYPPKNVKLPGNVKIALAGALPAALAEPKAADEWKKLFEEWRSKAPICMVWMYTDSFRSNVPHLPLVIPHLVAKEIKALAGKTEGFFFCGGETETGPYTQPEYYLAAELMWDVKQDTEELLDEFYRSLYGKAAGSVKACYTYLENLWLEEYPKNYSGMSAKSPDQAEIFWQQIFTPERLVKALAFIDQARMSVEKYSPEWNRVNRCETQLLQSLGYSLKAGLKTKVAQEEAADQKALPVKVGNPPPLIDGKIDDQTWNRPPDGRMVYVSNGAEADQQTLVWLAQDKDNFYIAVKCMESAMNQLAAKKSPSPESFMQTIFGDNDDVELFFDTTNSCSKYYQIALDPTGQTWSAGPKGSDITKVDFRYAAGMFDAYWTAEFAIPFSQIGGTPASGTRWGINVTRTQRPKAGEKETKYYAWFPSGNFHEAAKFGKIQF
ncbi:MAG: DUF4838 domain-containing protein [Candidatus Omnitrophota bacterium]